MSFCISFHCHTKIGVCCLIVNMICSVFYEYKLSLSISKNHYHNMQRNRNVSYDITTSIFVFKFTNLKIL